METKEELRIAKPNELIIVAKTTFICQYLEFLPKTETRKGVDSHVS